MLSFNVMEISGFEPKVILKSFLSVKVVTSYETERNILKSLLISSFIIQQREQNDKQCINSAKINL